MFIWGFAHPWTGLEVDGQLMMGSDYFYSEVDGQLMMGSDYFYSCCFCVLKVFLKKFNYYYYYFILN